MQNKELASAFKLTYKLMELHGENPFKTKSYSNAAFRIDRLQQQLADVPYDAIQEIDGIGKSLAAKIVELLETGELTYLQDLIGKTPSGILDMLTLKGIGPKKIGVIWRELGVESLGELLYACNENRLVDLKGFGAKTQQQVRQLVEYKLANSGKQHYAAVAAKAEELVKFLKEKVGHDQVSLTGEMRRKCDVISKVEVLVAGEVEVALEEWTEQLGTEVELVQCPSSEFQFRLFETTADPEHLKHLKLEGLDRQLNEEQIYHANGLSFIVPEMREGRHELGWSKNHQPDDLVEMTNLKGILHNHSTWSDGRHSLEEMAAYCKELGYEYLGMCDHSRSAFYANGLDAARVAAQQKEIDKLNQQLAPFRIFKGIESDILNDGSLDYEEEVLQSFDFIVASVHSNLRMDEEKATSRLLTAIANPYTTILGHPTGRLLLSRKGYPIDHKKVIDACAEHGVVIELNANPFRLDLDWRWVHYAQEQGVMVSINPDAHHKEGYHHMYYGVCAARKGGLLRENTFNALSKAEIEVYFQNRSRA